MAERFYDSVIQPPPQDLALSGIATLNSAYTDFQFHYGDHADVQRVNMLSRRPTPDRWLSPLLGLA
jgi:hypothetical protein